MAVGDKIYLADKQTLDDTKNNTEIIKASTDIKVSTRASQTSVDTINTKVGANSDVAGTGTVFARLRQIFEYLDVLFQSVSNGKNIIASAITDMGQAAQGGNTFAQLSAKIKDISKDATATQSQVLTGQTFYQGGLKRTGSMANRGAVTNTITMQGGQYTIPVGYHSGSGKVTANFANLVAGNVKKGINVGGVVGTYEEGNSIKSIQRGTVYTRENKMEIKISAVNMNNSIVRIYRKGDNYNDGTIFAKTAILKDSTTIEVESYSSYYSDPYYFTYEVIEFKKAKSKQSGLLERKPGIAANTPLSRVNPAKCLVSFSNRASSSSDNSAIDFFINFTLSAESLRFDFGSDSKSKQYVAWEVLEFD